MHVDAKHGSWSAPCAVFTLTVSFLLFLFGRLIRYEGTWTFDILANRHGWDRAQKADCCNAAGRVYLVIGILLCVVYALSTRTERAESASLPRPGENTDFGGSSVPPRQANAQASVRGRLRSISQQLRAGAGQLYNALRRLVGLAPVVVPRARRGGLPTYADSTTTAASSTTALFTDARRHSYNEMDALNLASVESTRPTTPVSVVGFDPVGRLRSWFQHSHATHPPGSSQTAQPRSIGTSPSFSPGPYRAHADPSMAVEAAHPPGHARRLAGRGGRRRREGLADSPPPHTGELVLVNAAQPASPPLAPTAGAVTHAPWQDLFVPSTQSPSSPSR